MTNLSISNKLMSVFECLKILLRFFMKQKKGLYLVSIPSYRLDIKNKEDLVEEIGKTYGYDSISGHLPTLQQKKIFADKSQFYRDLIRQKLISLGYQEVITYSLISEKENDLCFSEKGKAYKLLSPKSENHICYRQSLLPSHLKAMAYNLMHQNENLFFFEISRIYFFLIVEETREEEILALSGTGKIVSNPAHKLENDYDFF